MIIAVDIETTGLDIRNAHVIEIGAVAENGDYFSSICNPGLPFDSYSKARAINRIEVDDIKVAKTEKEVAKDFNDWLEKMIDTYGRIRLIGFNSDNYDSKILFRHPWNIDRTMWGPDIMYMAQREMGHAGVLSVRYGRYKWPKLSEAQIYYKIEPEGEAHRALEDARVTLKIYDKIMERNPGLII